MQLTGLAAKGARWTTVSAAFAAMIQVLRLVVLARLLSPNDFGLMAMAMIVIDTCQAYIDLGISAAIIHRQDATKKQLSSLYWLNVFAGWAMFALVWLCVPLIVMLFKEQRVLPLLHVITLVLLIAPLGQQFECLLQKELKFDTLAKQEIVSSILGFVTAVVLAVRGFGVWALVFSVLTTVSVKALLLVGVGLMRFRPSLHFETSDLKGFLSFGLFQMGERVINFFSERLDQLLIGSMLGANALGYYTFAFNLTAQPITRINPIITRVAFPVFSKVQNDLDRLRRGYLRVLSFLTTINAPLLVGLGAVAPVAIPMIFGTKWVGSILLVQLLSTVSLIRSTCNPIGSLQLARGRADLGFHWNLFLLIASVPTIYIGGRVAQATGVASALLLLQVVLVVPVYFFLVKPLIGECGRAYAAAILKPTAAALAMGGILLLLQSTHGGLAPALELVFLVTSGIGIYFLLVRVIDRTMLYEFRTVLLGTAG